MEACRSERRAGWSVVASRLRKLASDVALHTAACLSTKLTGPAPVTADVTSKSLYPLTVQDPLAITGPVVPG